MTHRTLFGLVSLSLALGSALGCTVTGNARPDSGGGPRLDSGPGSRVDTGVITGDVLLIRPADQDRTITGAPVVIDYTAIHHAADGTETDVTAMTTFSAVSLGTFAGARFTSTIDRGGLTTIYANHRGQIATTGLTLHLSRDILAPDAPADARTRFGGTPNPANAPTIVYPDDGVMVPPNLERFELHFMPNGSTLFRLDVATGAVTLRVFFGCSERVGAGCIYTPDHNTWGAISDGGRGLDAVTYTLTGTDSMGRVGTSAPRTIQFARENITGGVYYWNAAAGSIMRYEFGVPGAVEETYLRGGGIACIGCHALSRDGTRIAVGIGIPTQIFRVYDVATRMQVFQQVTGGGVGGMNGVQPDFFSFSPDSTQVVTSNPHGLNIADVATGAVSAALHNITRGVSTMPDWSPDGRHIVYVAPTGGGPAIEAPAVTSGSIMLVDSNGTTWSPGATLAPANGGNNYHPAYAPDGNWIVYNRSPSNLDSMGGSGSSGGSCVSDAQLWMVAPTGGSAPVLLDIGGVCSSWPKFDPTTYQDHGHPLFWVAWASGRGYGLRYADGSLMQIWMAAFDPTRAAAGMSPTHAAFRLPFQNIASGNHVAQWVTSVQRMMCTTPADCPGGEFCYMGRCFQTPPAPS